MTQPWPFFFRVTWTQDISFFLIFSWCFGWRSGTEHLGWGPPPCPGCHRHHQDCFISRGPQQQNLHFPQKTLGEKQTNIEHQQNIHNWDLQGSKISEDAVSSFWWSSLGLSLSRAAWREQKLLPRRCRNLQQGQLTPLRRYGSKGLVYAPTFTIYINQM